MVDFPLRINPTFAVRCPDNRFVEAEPIWVSKRKPRDRGSGGSLPVTQIRGTEVNLRPRIS